MPVLSQARPEHCRRACPEHCRRARPEHCRSACPEHCRRACPEQSRRACPEQSRRACPEQSRSIKPRPGRGPAASSSACRGKGGIRRSLRTFANIRGGASPCSGADASPSPRAQIGRNRQSRHTPHPASRARSGVNFRRPFPSAPASVKGAAFQAIGKHVGARRSLGEGGRSDH
jgi:hypothetical protein